MVFVRIKKLPIHIKAFVLPDEEGDYNIYINEYLSEDAKRKSLAHELRHIAQGDCYSDKSAREIEVG